MTLILEFSENDFQSVFNNTPKWDNLTLGGSPGKKRPKKKKSSKGIKKFKNR